MPELPDVETFRRYINQTSLNKKINDVAVGKSRLLKDTSAATVRRRLKDAKFTKTDRHGKHLFVKYGKEGWLMLHFGMTGDLAYFKSDDDEPDYTKLNLTFSNGYHLAYTCRRMLGEIGLTDDPEKYISDNDLGPDAWDDSLDADKFKELLSRSRGAIKTALMNQSIIAGLGNVYTDETLFQAGIKPQRNMSRLSDKDLANVFRTMRRVLRVTIGKKAQPQKLPRTYLTGNRDEGSRCPRCGGTINRKTISGRATYFCPDHQE